MLTNGPNLGLLVNGAAGEEHYDEIIAQWRGLDGLVQCTVIQMDTGTPPSSPSDGLCYIVGPSATGAWATHENRIARWSATLSAWEFYAPNYGWRAWLVISNYMLTYNAGTWQRVDAPLLAEPFNIATTSHTFALTSFHGRVHRFTSASAVTATVPLNTTAAIPVGGVITLRQVGAGQVTIVHESSGTLNVPTGFQAKTARQGSTVMLNKVASDEWDLVGDLAPA